MESTYILIKKQARSAYHNMIFSAFMYGCGIVFVIAITQKLLSGTFDDAFPGDWMYVFLTLSIVTGTLATAGKWPIPRDTFVERKGNSLVYRTRPRGNEKRLNIPSIQSVDIKASSVLLEMKGGEKVDISLSEANYNQVLVLKEFFAELKQEIATSSQHPA
ncbi:MAG: hypothetical protein AAFY71_02500 [Bacteroidota bacterium]